MKAQILVSSIKKVIESLPDMEASEVHLPYMTTDGIKKLKFVKCLDTGAWLIEIDIVKSTEK